MNTAKASVGAETGANVAASSKELLLAAIKRKNIPHKTVEVNAEGHIVADKDKDPELYDWAVNG